MQTTEPTRKSSFQRTLVDQKDSKKGVFVESKLHKSYHLLLRGLKVKVLKESVYFATRWGTREMITSSLRIG